MPWGKYAGLELDRIPVSYLAWVLENCRSIPLALKREIRQILDAAEEVTAAEPPPQAGGKFHPPADWSDILSRWHREMVLRFHPDRGGSHEAMVALNVAFERLQELVRAA